MAASVATGSDQADRAGLAYYAAEANTDTSKGWVIRTVDFSLICNRTTESFCSDA